MPIVKFDFSDTVIFTPESRNTLLCSEMPPETNKHTHTPLITLAFLLTSTLIPSTH